MANAPPQRRMPRQGTPAEPRGTVRHHDYQWAKHSLAYRAAHPLCQDCLERGVTTAAAEVHHIVKVRERPDLMHDDDNLRSLCESCHAIRTARGE